MSFVGTFLFNNNDKTSSVPASPISKQRNSIAEENEASARIMRRRSSVSKPTLTNSPTNQSQLEEKRPKSMGGSAFDNKDDHTDKAAVPQPSGSETPIDSIDSEDAVRNAEVLELARSYTRNSSYSQAGNPFEEQKENSSIDPNSPNFNARAWVKSMLNLSAQDPDLNPRRKAGFACRGLSAHGFGAATDYQKSVGNVVFETVGIAKKLLGMGQKRRIDILRDFDLLVESGEMLVVLGPPGSGCSTLLKTISGETHGFFVDENSHFNYQGISAKQMHKDFRGEAIYTAEVDVHFPQLSVGDTLTFAARARAPRHIPAGIERDMFTTHTRDAVMAMFGISHTIDTRVGNDFIRGVSGGERKRVTISEAALSRAPLQCWDNSTRGLDSANAIEFCKTLRTETELLDATVCVAIYQSPQSAYDFFDKVIVLYEGRQIYFGKTTDAKDFFVRQGFVCPDRQTTADFLTSMTSPAERLVREGFENQVPRTPDDFAAAWKNSPERQRLLKDIDRFDQEHPIGGDDLQQFVKSRRAQQAKRQRVKSPYTLSYGGQVKLCLWRGFQRLRGDPSLTFTQLFGNTVMGLVIGSVFYNLADDTNSFYQRGALLFFAILTNAFGSALEILTLYAQRPIVEKHARYALYHPSAEAFASMLTDMPYKIVNTICFNLVLYFLTNLRRTPSAFFFFILISFFLTLTMSMLFRTIASVSRTLSQALAPAAILILAIVIYTGFAIPVSYMHGWARWINYLDPVAYGFEALMINEFHDRNFTCTSFVPSQLGYSTSNANRVCSAVGSIAGSSVVRGDDYINSSFRYFHAHKWRNFGIMLAIMIFLMLTYLAAAEYITAKKSKGEVLLFRRGHIPAALKESGGDEEAVSTEKKGVTNQQVSAVIEKQTAVFQWRDVCYDIKIKGEERRILDHVDGWVKPGTLTALMGVSGAGKTTLLDVLATRTTMGVISGEMLVDGSQRDDSFQRKTGYVQQQDLHLETSTVREALKFSALLRQPAHVSKREKLEYVEEVIKLLDMEEYADAVIGVPGEGLNVEQRKRLTIGVELAAKPQLLLFLDEPTSGLDSQTSWAICDLMEKLTKNGQAVLCTIHQPSAMLFQRFDRLLFLAKGGKTVYYGEVGENSKVLIDYFERNGAFPCPKEANPAEWMLEVIGAAPGSHSDIDWHSTWRDSPEYQDVHAELDQMRDERPNMIKRVATKDNKASYREFAAPFGVQLWEVQKRVFEQYWRTPSYIYSKIALCLFSGLFIGFSFYKASNSQQGLQNQMFALFMMLTIFGQLVQQIMPHFVTQRALYEVRERPSKAYSWKAFMIANITIELCYNALVSVLMFFTIYYPVGLYRNAVPTGEVAQRGALFFLFTLQFLLFTSTFTNMVIAGIDTAETGGNIGNLMFILTLIFCGVLASPTALPGFWIFMYRVSPFTYLIDGMLSTAVANTNVVCAANEFLNFSPPDGKTCGQYMQPYIGAFGGYLREPGATSDCSFCQLDSTNTFLSHVNSNYALRWRNFGILWVYILFNIVAAVFFYWWIRVPKDERKRKVKGDKEKVQEKEKGAESEGTESQA